MLRVAVALTMLAIVAPARADKLDDALAFCLKHWNYQKGTRPGFEAGMEVCSDIREQSDRRDAENAAKAAAKPKPAPPPAHPHADEAFRMLREWKQENGK